MSDLRKMHGRRGSDVGARKGERDATGVEETPPPQSDPTKAASKDTLDEVKIEHEARDFRRRAAVLVLLERDNLISRGTRMMLERYMEQWGLSAFHAVLETHILTETELADALAASLRIDRIFNPQQRQLHEAVVRRIGFRRARQWECLPIIRDFNNLDIVDLVIADPTQEDRIAALRLELGMNLSLAVAERSVIVGAIDELFPLSVQLPTLFAKS